ncbi:excisionase family DNA-binding protein [Streptacidiphilus sp. ASG 303]|uniref:excisionase family DNA-binding protein n=1 Tax=Streptacidiphilus sp. ASG 303 TaxID=2896847 RepID=UPI001E46EBB4|nr:excisionase family DNA-binding protein [Streptacidiphilus sp. ASG 303]MCD0482338.1 excisionase family DNA-binding protein [Streptacidiphilus sp. ASG 303]
MPDGLLTIAQVAEILSTTERFPRRLIEERRITFVKVGRHVRIPADALAAYIAANTVHPAPLRRPRLGVAA